MNFMTIGCNTLLIRILAMTQWKFITIKVILISLFWWKIVIPTNLVIHKKSMPWLKTEDTFNIQTCVTLSLTFNRRTHITFLHFINIIKLLNITMIIKIYKQEIELKDKVWLRKNSFGIQPMLWLIPIVY